jgi:DNA modification methylase
MTPYFETESGKLYHGKCEDILPHLPVYDLLLTDPPYGIGIKNKVGGKNLAESKDYGDHNRWDEKPPSPEVFALMFGRSKEQIIFGGNYFIECLTNSSCWIVWDKDNSGNFADCELAWTSFKSAVRKIKFRWNGMLQEYGGKAKEKRYHPTQKPVNLFTQILEMYSEKGQTVLDCYAGSGTTALACMKMSRNWALIEEQEKYCEVIQQRIEKVLRQPEMFPGFGVG